MDYDIVYSITAHECIECVDNLYENIMKFNKGLNCLVLFNINNFLMFQKDSLKKRDNLLFNPFPSEKGRFDHTIFQAHIDNYELIKDYNFRFFSLLASNCMFIKQTNISLIEKMAYYCNNIPNKIPSNNWSYQNLPIYDDKNHFNLIGIPVHNGIMSLLIKNELEPTSFSHEAAFLRKEVIDCIFQFCKKNSIDKNMLYDGVAWEEIIFPSLEKYMTNGISPRYCTIVYEEANNEYITNIIKNEYENKNVFKRVSRNMGNDLRKFINTL